METGFHQFVLDQLHGMPGVTCRAMFGGYGLYQNGQFFGIIHKSRLYFKIHDRTKAHYLQHGMTPFRPNRSQTLKNYYEVPAEVIEDPDRLISWAQDAIGC
jgi:DNA transformation protein